MSNRAKCFWCDAKKKQSDLKKKKKRKIFNSFEVFPGAHPKKPDVNALEPKKCYSLDHL